MKYTIKIHLTTAFIYSRERYLTYLLLPAPCESDDECGLLEACTRGQCSNLCDQNRACGLNAICDMVNHGKECTCPAGFTGTAKSECYRLPTYCQSEADCQSGFMCKSGGCVPQCRGHEECAQNEKCIEGSCTREFC